MPPEKNEIPKLQEKVIPINEKVQKYFQDSFAQLNALQMKIETETILNRIYTRRVRQLQRTTFR
jgi:hypothetical protein